jgi:transposase
VTATGALRFRVFTGTCTAEVFTDFCAKLLADTPGPVYLIVDGHPAHKAKATKEFVASTGGRLKLFTLPAYSPQLNPDEWVWKNVKHDRIGRTSVSGLDDLTEKAIAALRRLQDLPGLIRGFFADPHLRYITA